MRKSVLFALILLGTCIGFGQTRAPKASYDTIQAFSTGHFVKMIDTTAFKITYWDSLSIPPIPPLHHAYVWAAGIGKFYIRYSSGAISNLDSAGSSAFMTGLQIQDSLNTLDPIILQTNMEWGYAKNIVSYDTLTMDTYVGGTPLIFSDGPLGKAGFELSSVTGEYLALNDYRHNKQGYLFEMDDAGTSYPLSNTFAIFGEDSMGITGFTNGDFILRTNHLFRFMNNTRIEGYQDQDSIAIPATPANHVGRWFFDGSPKFKYPNGTVHNLDSAGGSGGVTSVGATLPLASSGGTTPTISSHKASASDSGYIDAAHYTKWDGTATTVVNDSTNWNTAYTRSGLLVADSTNWNTAYTRSTLLVADSTKWNAKVDSVQNLGGAGVGIYKVGSVNKLKRLKSGTDVTVTDLTDSISFNADTSTANTGLTTLYQNSLKQNTLTTGNLTASAPAAVSGSRTVIGGAANITVDTSTAGTGLTTLYQDGLKVLKTTTITVAGTTNQVISSAGAQDLSANRTWTLSTPQNIDTSASTKWLSALYKGTLNTPFFGLTSTTFNKNFSSLAQASDTSAIIDSVTGTGHPVLSMRNATGAVVFLVDSTGTISAGANTIDTIYTKAVANVTVSAPITRSVSGKTYNIGADTSAGGTHLATQNYVSTHSGVTGTLTNKYIPIATGTSTLGDSPIDYNNTVALGLIGVSPSTGTFSFNIGVRDGNANHLYRGGFFGGQGISNPALSLCGAGGFEAGCIRPGLIVFGAMDSDHVGEVAVLSYDPTPDVWTFGNANGIQVGANSTNGKVGIADDGGFNQTISTVTGADNSTWLLPSGDGGTYSFLTTQSGVTNAQLAGSIDTSKTNAVSNVVSSDAKIVVTTAGKTKSLATSGVAASGANADITSLTGLTGAITKINNISTEAGGAPAICDTISRATQSASITSTNFNNTSTAGFYQVSGYVECTTAGSAGTVTLTLAWTDDVGATTTVPVNLFTLATTGRIGFAPQSIFTASGSVSYSTTVASVVGSPKYKLVMTAIKLF